MTDNMQQSALQSLAAAMEQANKNSLASAEADYSDYVDYQREQVEMPQRKKASHGVPSGPVKNLFAVKVKNPWATHSEPALASNGSGMMGMGMGGIGSWFGGDGMDGGEGDYSDYTIPAAEKPVDVDPRVSEILEKAAVGIEPLTEMEIGELRGHLLASLRTSANPLPFVEKYLAVLSGHSACDKIMGGLGIDLHGIYSVENARQTVKPYGGAFASDDTSDFLSFGDSGVGEQSINQEPGQAVKGGIKRKSLFQIASEATAPPKMANYGMYPRGMGMMPGPGMGMNMMGMGMPPRARFPRPGGVFPLMSGNRPSPTTKPKPLLETFDKATLKKEGIASLFGMGLDVGQKNKKPEDPMEEIGSVSGFEAEHEIGHYGDTPGSNVGQIAGYGMGMPSPWGFRPPWGGPMMRGRMMRPPFGPMGPYGYRPPVHPGPPKPDSTDDKSVISVPGQGPGGWLSGAVHPMRRGLFGLSASADQVNLEVYKAVRRIHEEGEPHWEDAKVVRDCINRLLNHNGNPFPIVALYGTFLPVKLMEKLLTNDMKLRLTNAAQVFGVSPKEVKFCVTGKMPQMLPKVLRAPWEDVEAIVHKDRSNEKMPAECKVDDPSTYKPHEIPGILIRPDGSVSNELTKRTRNWIEAVLYMLSRNGQWPHDKFLLMLKEQFGEEAIDKFMEAEKTVRCVVNGTEQRMKDISLAEMKDEKQEEGMDENEKEKPVESSEKAE